ncbi:hypothetical protein TNCV_1243051 [Trichonephila clavipes]|nr:hypothetical protein TNCV_1243051 [Trichonephila clavipes]
MLPDYTLSSSLCSHQVILILSEQKDLHLCNGQDQQASPEHIMPCMDLTSKDILTEPLLVLGFLRVKDLMDVV